MFNKLKQYFKRFEQVHPILTEYIVSLLIMFTMGYIFLVWLR